MASMVWNFWSLLVTKTHANGDATSTAFLLWTLLAMAAYSSSFTCSPATALIKGRQCWFTNQAGRFPRWSGTLKTEHDPELSDGGLVAEGLPATGLGFPNLPRGAD
jgi:hypothetical protein